MKWFKKTALGLAAGLVFLMPSEAMAAERITSVSLEIETDFQIGDDCSEDDIIITPKSGLYYVDDIEILNEVNEWGNADTPRIDVYLQAEDGYYFLSVPPTSGSREAPMRPGGERIPIRWC